jgi:hypothetical protein
MAIVWQLGLFFLSYNSFFCSLIYNHTTLCSHMTITIFAYGILIVVIFKLFCKGLLFTCGPPNSLITYYNLSFSMWVKAHYMTPFGVSYCTTFQGCACLSVSHVKLLKDFHKIFAYYVTI